MIKLPIFPIVDFSKLSINDKVSIEITNTIYKFSPDADISGYDERRKPIFGANVFINKILTQSIPYGLPPLLFPQGSAPLINFINNTKFTTNLHFHGLVNTGLVDGASSFGVFGQSTSLGTNVNIQFPIIKNNSALTWYHSHAMFRSVQLANAGMAGTIVITDSISQSLNDLFIYGDNYAILTCSDIDLDKNGCQTFANLTVDVNRSCFTTINGISTIQWYAEPNKHLPFTNLLCHNTCQNIIKFDILNPTGNWRVLYLGVCDSNKNIIPFYVIQTDQGLCAPVYTTIQFIPVAGRISILVDLTHIKNAYLFFYDYDLTENFGNYVDPNGNFNNTYIFPDFTNESSTPYPTPIPDPFFNNDTNQQSDPTNLKYPIVPIIQQQDKIMTYGYYPIPNTSSIRPFLYISNISKNNDLSISNILSMINNIIYKKGIQLKDLNSQDNYLVNLNPNYYYNLPNVSPYTPIRNICLWGENDINYIRGGVGNAYITDKMGNNVYGVSECCNGANRIYADLWNSAELDLNEALYEYSLSPNNYKPRILPTSEFRITKTNDDYINIAMISNDNFIIQAFKTNISYKEKDINSKPIFSVQITLPPTPQISNLNIQEWIDLLNTSLSEVNYKLDGKSLPIADILKFDWSFFPYGVNLLDGTTKYIKSAIIKTKNNSNYHIRLLGRWSILQMFGKSMVANVNTTPPKQGSGPCCSTNAPCDEEYLYGVYDNYIQSWYPYYATNDENEQKPILCPRRNAQLIIEPKQTYVGLYDGFANDNLRSFSTKLKSTEIWTYLNADVGDSHPLHFHLTSGFSYQSLTPTNNIPNTPGSNKTLGFTQTYSRDIYQIGPQQSLSFALTWTHYSSEDTTNSPYIPNIGAVIHCHFLPHNDSNSMMITYGVKPLSNIISDNCFCAGTLIEIDQDQDQCILPIETIIPEIHTINNKKIVAITKTISLDNFLVCFEENSLENNVPSKKTYLTRHHKILYKGKMLCADTFIKNSNQIYNVKYNGDVLYNVLMENPDLITVNNMICETLDPMSNTAKLFKSISDLNYDDYNEIVNSHNNYSIRKNVL
jgi:FtsP/CotA-like multicopper oxidase with cupredoxin domain